MVDIVTQPTRVKTAYVEWGAVLAGAVVASALSFVLLTAGAAIGLSLISPYASQSHGRLAVAVAAFWTLVVPIFSFLIGGYIAGRMRAAWENANADEVEFRDGIHGLLVWAVSIVFGGLLAFLSAGSIAQSSAEVAKASLADRSTIVAPAVDALMRGTTVAQPSTAPAAQVSPPTTSKTSQALFSAPDVRAEVTRTLAAAVTAGALKPADREYLAQVVAQRTGLAPAEAERRVDEAYAEAVRAVETARKAAVLAGLATATALLLGLAAAWYAAQRGGHHRDQNIPAKFVWPARRPTTP